MSTPVKKGSAEKSDGYRPYKVFRQGFLLIHPPRSSMSRKKLTRYWFVLFEQKDLLAFLYFLDEDHYLERKKNEGFFRIDDATSVDVLPDYMGRKNAMCITTPRNKYVLVSESRYELHGWIFALHNAMDEFKKNSLHKKKKISTGNRPRSTSTSGTTIATTPTASGSGNGPSKSLPRIKPSRPAPPVPQSKKKSDSEISATSNDKQESTSPAHSANNDQDEQSLVIPKVATTSSLDVLVAGLLAETKDLDTLQFNMIEEEPENDSNLANGTADNFISMQTSQNNEQHKEDYQSSDNQESEHNSQDEHSKNFSESYEDLGGGRNTVPLDNRSRKKSTKKRLSMKGPRSVSPPNIPPPPPPVVVTNEGQDEENSHQVMKTLTEFSNALDEMSININTTTTTTTTTTSHKPKPLPPLRTTSLSPKKERKDYDGLNDNDSVHNYMDEAFRQEDDNQLSPTSPEGDEEGVFEKENIVPETKENTAHITGKKQGSNQSYEPRIDKEGSVDKSSISVVQAKARLFGGQVPSKVTHVNKSSTSDESDTPQKVEPAIMQSDDLIQSIELALESTSYMETVPHHAESTKKGFTTIVGEEPPPIIAPPTRYTLSSEVPQEENSTVSPVNEIQLSSTTTTFTLDDGQNPMYRSVV